MELTPYPLIHYMKAVNMLNSQLKLEANVQNSLEDDFIDDGGLVTDIAKPKLKPPAMYKVLMLNDDYTPMDFVVEVLQAFFSKSGEQATEIMLAVHQKGSASCGVFSKDIAETKAAMVNDYAKECQYPLLCEVLPVSNDG